MSIKLNIYFYLLLILISCSDFKKDSSQKKKFASVSKITKEISNNSFRIKVIMERDKLSFEVLHQNVKKNVSAINEFGEISFTSSSPLVSYIGDSISTVDYLFYKNDFLLFPIEDWNGNRIFYKIPLKINSIKDTIYPFFILKNQYCLFNQRTGVLLAYETLKKEYLIDDKSYFLTDLSLFHLGSSSEMNEIQFRTQKEIGLLENVTPVEVKKHLLDAISVFFDRSIFDAYFE